MISLTNPLELLEMSALAISFPDGVAMHASSYDIFNSRQDILLLDPCFGHIGIVRGNLESIT